MFDHVTIRVSDRAASERFYTTVLATIGRDPTNDDEWDDFSIAAADAGNPVTRRLHIGFAAPSREHVDAFWRAGVDAGHRDDGAPGLRPEYADDYYGGFLLDPDGNSAEAVHHSQAERRRGIDHLWIRVADLAAARRFYETVAPQTGFHLRGEGPGRWQFRGPDASFSIVDDTPTEHVHLAFPASDDATVDAFHAAATAAGYRDNGPPGERAIYHDGYYGAYVLDPDGNNVKVVHHNR